MSSPYTNVAFSSAEPDQRTAVKLNKLRDDLSTAIGSAGGGGGGTPVSGTVIFGETPGGTVDGSNKNFTSAQTYGANKLAVFLNGVRQRRGNDYNETGTSSFSFVLAPVSGDILSIDYQH